MLDLLISKQAHLILECFQQLGYLQIMHPNDLELAFPNVKPTYTLLL